MRENPQGPDLEARLAADEQRLLRDEERIEVEEEQVERNRTMAFIGIALAAILGIAVAALVLAVLALRRDVDALGLRDAPDGSVSASALQDGSVTASKLATGAVGANALAPGSVGSAQVAPNSLTGHDIVERSLGTVPKAGDSTELAGRPAGAYLVTPTTVSETGVTNTAPTKALTAHCPGGARVLSGGAAVQGAAAGAALVRSIPDGTTGWTATARVSRTPAPSWRLVVTAICTGPGG